MGIDGELSLKGRTQEITSSRSSLSRKEKWKWVNLLNQSI